MKREQTTQNLETIVGISKESLDEKRAVSKKQREREETLKTGENVTMVELEEENLSRIELLQKKKQLQQEQRQIERQELQFQREIQAEKKKIENIEKALESTSYLIRTKALGLDRHYNRYWIFNTSLGFCQGYVYTFFFFLKKKFKKKEVFLGDC